MTTRTLAVLVFILTAAAATATFAQQTIAGTWTLVTEHLPLRLVLAQTDRAVTGTLDYPHGKPFQLTGAFASNTLTFSGDSSGENFTIHISSTASLGADGSLAGTIHAHIVDLDEAHQPVRTHDDEMPWTAVRKAD